MFNAVSIMLNGIRDWFISHADDERKLLQGRQIICNTANPIPAMTAMHNRLPFRCHEMEWLITAIHEVEKGSNFYQVQGCPWAEYIASTPYIWPLDASQPQQPDHKPARIVFKRIMDDDQLCLIAIQNAAGEDIPDNKLQWAADGEYEELQI